MSIIVFLVLLFAVYCFYNEITGRNTGSTDVNPTSKTEKDIDRLREIADYDRWENSGRKDS